MSCSQIVWSACAFAGARSLAARAVRTCRDDLLHVGDEGAHLEIVIELFDKVGGGQTFFDERWIQQYREWLRLGLTRHGQARLIRARRQRPDPKAGASCPTPRDCGPPSW